MLVDEARENHFNDIHGCLVGHAQAGSKLALDVQPREHCADLRAAAMDDNRVHTGLLEEDHVLGEVAGNLLVPHGMPAIFHDDGGIIIAQHMRQSVNQNLGLFMRIGCSHDRLPRVGNLISNSV